MSNSIERTYFKSRPDGVVENEYQTIITGCSIVTSGEARGHGVMLDESFVQTCYEQAESLKMGLKARFGHPSMCNEALGTFVGWFRNFSLSEDGDKVYADLYLAESAKKAPHGDLHAYIKSFASEAPDAFGTSIVFKSGPNYRKDADGNKYRVDSMGTPIDPDVFEDDLSEEIYASCEKLMGCDFVDEPAANPDGLFSEYHGGTVAGQVAMFFESEPHVFEALLNNPEIVTILKEHGDKLDTFMCKLQEINMAKANKETKPEGEVEELSTEVEPVVTAETVEVVEAIEPEPESEVVLSVKPEATETEPMSLSAYRALATKYGAEIADKVADEGKDEAYAKDLFIEKLNKDNKELQAKLELDKESTTGVAFNQERPKKRDILAQVNI
jgi:hypothetical protein